MKPGSADPALLRALELSRRLLDAVQAGDLQAVIDLDAERGRLLRRHLDAARRIDAAERDVLDEIQRLNEYGLQQIERRRRDTATEFAQLGRGRRAVDAYATNQRRSG